MKKFFVIFFFIILSISNISIANAEIAFIDMEKILTNSNAGKSVLNQLEALNKKTLENFQKKEKELKDKENKLISQKNILSSSDYNTNLKSLRSEFDDYSSKRKTTIKNFNNVKNQNTNKLLKEVNLILANYSEKNSISIILQKKSIVSGKSSLDISEDILKIVNENVKEWKIK